MSMPQILDDFRYDSAAPSGTPQGNRFVAEGLGKYKCSITYYLDNVFQSITFYPDVELAVSAMQRMRELSFVV